MRAFSVHSAGPTNGAIGGYTTFRQGMVCYVGPLSDRYLTQTTIMSNVQFIFFDHPIAAPIHEHWRKFILELLPEEARGRVSVIEGAFEDIRGSSADFDCLVSPANSYGLMDGG